MLARDLGMTRGQLRAVLSCDEFAWWIALYNVEAAEKEAERRKQQQRPRGR